MYLDSFISPAAQIRDSCTFRCACVLRICNFEEVLCAIGICYFITVFLACILSAETVQSK